MTTTATVAQAVFATISVPKEITLDRVRSLLCSAFEGGIGYWCRLDGYKFADGIVKEDFYDPRGRSNPPAGKSRGRFTDPDEYHPSYLLVPFVEGCAIKICSQEDPGKEFANDWEPTKKQREEDNDAFGGDQKYFLLTREKLAKGLEQMAKDAPRHFKNFIDENDDSETGDVFVQMCVFGKIVFG